MLKGKRQSPCPESSALHLEQQAWTSAHASGTPSDQQFTGHRVLAVQPLYLRTCCSPTWNTLSPPFRPHPRLSGNVSSLETSSPWPCSQSSLLCPPPRPSQKDLVSSSFAPSDTSSYLLQHLPPSTLFFFLIKKI